MAEAREDGWFTSSYSGSGNDQCVECRLDPAAAGIRDSKHRDGGNLAVSPTAWRTLLRHIIRG